MAAQNSVLDAKRLEFTASVDSRARENLELDMRLDDAFVQNGRVMCGWRRDTGLQEEGTRLAVRDWVAGGGGGVKVNFRC